MDDNLTKVLFRYYSDVLEDDVVETMWAEIIDDQKGLYKLDSIPFYGPMISCRDVFKATFDEVEKMLVFNEVFEFSGNSVIQIIIMNENFDKEILRKRLLEYGCESEGVNDKYFVVDIPSEIDYLEVKKMLEEFESKALIQFAEPVLSNQHFNDINIHNFNS